MAAQRTDSGSASTEIVPCAVPTPPGSVAEENEGSYDYGSYSYSEHSGSRRVLSTVGAEYNTTDCEETESGSDCAITCSSGYWGDATAFTCPSENIDETTQPTGDWPSCQALVGCAALSDMGQEYDESDCASVASGARCTVTCSEGFTSGGVYNEYECAAGTTDDSTQLVQPKPGLLRRRPAAAWNRVEMLAEAEEPPAVP